MSIEPGGVMILGGYVGWAAIVLFLMNGVLIYWLVRRSRAARELLAEQGKALSAMLKLIKKKQ